MTQHRRKLWTPTKEQWSAIFQTIGSLVPFLPPKYRKPAGGLIASLVGVLLALGIFTTDPTGKQTPVLPNASLTPISGGFSCRLQHWTMKADGTWEVITSDYSYYPPSQAWCAVVVSREGRPDEIQLIEVNP